MSNTAPFKRATQLEGDLVCAAQNGEVDIVRALLGRTDAGAATPAFCRGGQALRQAALNGCLDVVRTLLSWPVASGRSFRLARRAETSGLFECLGADQASRVRVLLRTELERMAAIVIPKMWRGRHARFEYIRQTSDPSTEAGCRRAMALWDQLQQ